MYSFLHTFISEISGQNDPVQIEVFVGYCAPSALQLFFPSVSSYAQEKNSSYKERNLSFKGYIGLTFYLRKYSHICVPGDNSLEKYQRMDRMYLPSPKERLVGLPTCCSGYVFPRSWRSRHILSARKARKQNDILALTLTYE